MVVGNTKAHWRFLPKPEAAAGFGLQVTSVQITEVATYLRVSGRSLFYFTFLPQSEAAAQPCMGGTPCALQTLRAFQQASS